MHFPARNVLAGLFLSVLAIACRSSGEAAAPEAAAGGARAADGYVLAFLVRGPSTAERTPEERKEIQAGHMANIGRLASERKIVVAGPFGKPVPDEALRGIFVFATDDLEQARAWTNTDPAVQAGSLGMELAGFRTRAKLREALEKDLAEEAERAKSGAQADMASIIRGYVMVLAKDARQARAALSEMRDQGKVLIEGELARSPRGSYVAVLDAQTVEEAAALLGARRSEIGEHELASWWASRSLAGLAEVKLADAAGLPDRSAR